MKFKRVNPNVKAQALKEADLALIDRFFANRLRLSHIRVLVAVGDSGQLKKVAEIMNVTPAAVSKQIREIEDSLRQEVMRRTGSGVVLTELGLLLARRGREVLDQLERTRVEVEAMCSGLSGRLGIGAGPSLSPLLFPALVLSLKRRAPNLTLVLKEDTFERLAPRLADSTIDILLTRFTSHRLIANFRQQTVFEDPLVIVCGNRHSLASKSHVSWHDLEGMAWILPATGTPTRAYLEQELAQRGLKLPAGCVESQTWTVHLEVLKAYPFLALIPATLARKYHSTTPMRVLPLTTGAGFGTVKAVWRADSDELLVNLVLETVQKSAQGWAEH